MEDILEIIDKSNINIINNNNINDNKKLSLNKRFSLSIGGDSQKDIINKSNAINIPDYLINPLFLNIELFMTEIENERKNYYMSYE